MTTTDLFKSIKQCDKAAKLKDKKSKATSKEVKNFNSAYFSPNPTGGMPYGVSQNMVCD